MLAMHYFRSKVELAPLKKRLAVIGGLALLFCLSACEGSGDPPRVDETESVQTPAATAHRKGKVVEALGPHGSKLTVHIPPGPPSRKLIVRDLERGSGPAVSSRKDVIIVNYLTIDYRTGNAFYDGWELGGPIRFLLEETHPGWEIGLKGMKAGGVRKLITPPRLEYGSGTLIFVIELVRLNPAEG